MYVNRCWKLDRLASIFRFSGYLHNSHNRALDWALRLNSYHVSNWLQGLHPRVSNSHWLLFPITATIESVRFYVIIHLNKISNLISASNLIYHFLIFGRGIAPSFLFFDCYIQHIPARHPLVEWPPNLPELLGRLLCFHPKCTRNGILSRVATLWILQRSL